MDSNCKFCGSRFIPAQRSTRFCSVRCAAMGRPKRQAKGVFAVLAYLAEHRRIVPETGCWEYTGMRWKAGYGGIWLGTNKEGRRIAVHRLVLFICEGLPWTDEREALHRCDNPPCFNPEHLFTGTQSDNMRDCARKGRRPSEAGASNPAAKLTPAQVEEIRSRRSAGESAPSIARAFSMGASQIYRICHRRSWRYQEAAA